MPGCFAWKPLMPQIIADPLLPFGDPLFFGKGIVEYQ
jgi:hypothetical protein